MECPHCKVEMKVIIKDITKDAHTPLLYKCKICGLPQKPGKAIEPKDERELEAL